MRIKLPLIFLAVVFVVVSYAILLMYRTENTGVETKYGSFVCMEFKNKSKNYVPEEIIIGVNAGVTSEQIQDLLAAITANLQKENPNYKLTTKQQLLTEGAYVLSVPKGWELNIIKKLQKSSYIEYAELNGCNQMGFSK